MELKDFVSETLNQLVEGIVTAQKYCGERGALVNPGGLTQWREKSECWDKATGELPSRIEFDIAITATEGKGTKGGIGVFVGPFGLGSEGKSEATKSSISRVKFSVVVHFPKSEPLKEIEEVTPAIFGPGRQ